MDTIQSKDNSLVKELKKLKEKKYRTEKQQFIVEGFRFVGEALKSSFKVPYILVSDSNKEKFDKFKIESGLQEATKVYWIKEQVLNSICSTETPQGIMAVVNNKEINIKGEDGFYILADRVQDPGNMGTIIRTAHAAGALGVIVTKGTVDLYNEKTLRSTMGSIFNIPIIEDKSYESIENLKSKGYSLLVSTLQGSESFYNIEIPKRVIVAVGNEGAGISEEILSLSDLRARIPMPGNAESLNAAVAASVMMFEIVRQRLTIAKK